MDVVLASMGPEWRTLGSSLSSMEEYSGVRQTLQLERGMDVSTLSGKSCARHGQSLVEARTINSVPCTSRHRGIEVLVGDTPV